MTGLLVRVGVDSEYGEWNAPVDPASGRFVYVPIPEKLANIRPGYGRPYLEIQDALANFGAPLPARLRGQNMHLDPDFSTLTYGDGGARANPIRKLKADDLLVFYAGLRSTKQEDRDLVYAIIGIYTVDEVVPVQAVPESKWADNAHTRRRSEAQDDDVIVRARKGCSGRLSRCLRVGERRDRAYRARRDLLVEWGGLSVKNGFLQRSGTIPSLLDPNRFQEWLSRQNIELIVGNNDGM